MKIIANLHIFTILYIFFSSHFYRHKHFGWVYCIRKIKYFCCCFYSMSLGGCICMFVALHKLWIWKKKKTKNYEKFQYTMPFIDPCIHVFGSLLQLTHFCLFHSIFTSSFCIGMLWKGRNANQRSRMKNKNQRRKINNYANTLR